MIGQFWSHGPVNFCLFVVPSFWPTWSSRSKFGQVYHFFVNISCILHHTQWGCIQHKDRNVSINFKTIYYGVCIPLTRLVKVCNEIFTLRDQQLAAVSVSLVCSVILVSTTILLSTVYWLLTVVLIKFPMFPVIDWLCKVCSSPIQVTLVIAMASLGLPTWTFDSHHVHVIQNWHHSSCNDSNVNMKWV